MRRFLPHSLGAQLLLMLLLALSVSHGLSVLVFSDERERAVRAALGYEAAGRAGNVARLLVNAPPDLRPQIIAAANSPLVRFWIDTAAAVGHEEHDELGIAERIQQTLGDASRVVRVEIHDRTLSHLEIEQVPASMRGMHAAMMAERTGPLELAISIKLNSGQWLNVRSMFHRPAGQWNSTDFAALAIAAFLVTVVSAITVWRVVRPMRSLALAAEHVGRGEVPSPLEEIGPSEVRDALSAFNTMQARLRRLITDRAQMLAALNHDLRSPLTAMRLRLELIEESEDRKGLETLVDEMQSMVEATLAFARGEAETEPAKNIELAPLLDNLATSSGDKVHISPEKLPDISVRVRPVSLKRALRNLIDNAIRYGGGAELAMELQGDEVVITIRDDGPGLPEDQIESVFKPFRRLEASRNRETGGVGLGLAIARSIVRAHGGEVTLANREPGGLEATVRLPAEMRLHGQYEA